MLCRKAVELSSVCRSHSRCTLPPSHPFSIVSSLASRVCVPALHSLHSYIGQLGQEGSSLLACSFAGCAAQRQCCWRFSMSCALFCQTPAALFPLTHLQGSVNLDTKQLFSLGPSAPFHAALPCANPVPSFVGALCSNCNLTLPLFSPSRLPPPAAYPFTPSGPPPLLPPSFSL